jgi:hypothetical protein
MHTFLLHPYILMNSVSIYRVFVPALMTVVIVLKIHIHCIEILKRILKSSGNIRIWLFSVPEIFVTQVYTYIVTWLSVTTEGFYIDHRIYWTLWYSAWLHFAVHSYTHTNVHIHVFTSRCLIAASTVDVPLPLGSRTVPGLRSKLLTATAHNNWTPEVT